jgi:hypothetical protein
VDDADDDHAVGLLIVEDDVPPVLVLPSPGHERVRRAAKAGILRERPEAPLDAGAILLGPCVKPNACKP